MVFNMRTFTLPIPRTKEDLLVIHGSPLKKFTLRELKLATNNFGSKNVVGRGGFGSVYRGKLADGSLVAIKRCIYMVGPGAELQFQAEIDIGGSPATNHRNILRLRGYCITQKERLLVYPFMVNRSVHSRLKGRRPVSEPPLDWPTRKRIALGAAKGLAHFHNGASFTVIHRDVKAANILLDDQFEAVLCDFGIAKLISKSGNESNWLPRPMEEEEQYDDEDPSEEEEDSDDDNFHLTKSCWNFTRTMRPKAEDEEESRVCTKWSCWLFTKNEVISQSSGHSAIENRAQPTYHEFCTHVTTAVRGTIGHIAPEYLATGKCSVKNDVFGYGVMLLELVTGQRVFDLSRLENDDDVMLLDLVKQRHEDHDLDLVVDSELHGDYIQEEMEQLIQLALLCTKSDPEKRPVMTEVIKFIENLGKSPLASFSVQQFSLPQLKKATNEFSNKNMIGKSGFSNVYRGRLQEGGSMVVVKRLVNRSKRGRIQFQAEEKLGGIISGKHPNLLQLLGYCVSGNERLLVYPFMPNRSLEWWLRPERTIALHWDVRKQIGLGVAKGIAYLHHDCDPDVSIWCDVKPSNILLDGEFNPVLCNLSLGHNKSSQNQVEGAACLIKTNDVYWYGITLLALISGKKVSDLNALATNNHANADSGLHNWFKKKLRQHRLDLLVDNQCDTIDVKDEIEQLIQVALLCTQPSPMDRPEMWEVIQMIEGICEGDLKVCFAFDRANLFSFNESQHEFELRAMIDSPQPDTEESITSEILQVRQVTSISSKGKAQETKLTSQSKGITISGNGWEPKMQERWRVFVSEVVSDALPTKSRLCRSGMSADPLCPLCNEYEEESLHLFFMCDFSKQVWQIAMGFRIGVLGFVSVKEAVDVILEPDIAGVDVLPPGVEASCFSHKSVAVMHSIWTHRNKVCFDKVCPNVMEVVSSFRNHVP